MKDENVLSRAGARGCVLAVLAVLTARADHPSVSRTPRSMPKTKVRTKWVRKYRNKKERYTSF